MHICKCMHSAAKKPFENNFEISFSEPKFRNDFRKQIFLALFTWIIDTYKIKSSNDHKKLSFANINNDRVKGVNKTGGKLAVL